MPNDAIEGSFLEKNGILVTAALVAILISIVFGVLYKFESQRERIKLKLK